METRIANERANTDRVLHAEREDVDATLTESRFQDRGQAVAEQLQTDRATTDRLLTTERASVDRALAARDEALGVASHDLRGMIGIVGLNANLIEDRTRGKDSTVKACLCDINTLAVRMTRLVEDLTDVVRIETGKLPVVQRTQDALALVREIHGIFVPVALARGVDLGRDTASSEILCSFDGQRISQVLSNLVGNAIKFSPAHGHVSIAAHCHEGELVFSVADQGCGIAADALEMVFERSWQAPGGAGVGSGLGLYICRGIVEAHGGRIWAESTLGEGSTFRFTLPTSDCLKHTTPAKMQAHQRA